MTIKDRGADRMNTIVVIFCTAWLVTSCSSSSLQRVHTMSFNSASEAIGFIAEQVRNDRSDTIFAVCLEPGDNEFFTSAVNRLKILDNESPLTELYANQSFPLTGNMFTLGGHGDEWGHVHIDFVKKRGKWYLKSIWQCR